MSAFDDYLQLLNNNPKMDATKLWANKLGKNVKTGIEDNLPKGTDPTAMLDFGFANNPISHAASMIGSMRLPSDIIQPNPWLDGLANGANDITQKQRNILNTVQSYFKKNWGGDNDQIVKYIDEGGRLNGLSGPTPINVGNAFRIPKNYLNSTVNRMLNIAANGKNRILNDEPYPQIHEAGRVIGRFPDGGARRYLDTPTQTVLDYITDPHTSSRNNFDDVDQWYEFGEDMQMHIDDVENIADTARAYRGTKQIAQTQAGKYYENINDLYYLQGLKKSDNYIGKPPPYESMVNKAPTWDIFKIAEKTHGNANRTSLIDLLKQTNEYDDYILTEAAQTKLRAHQDKQLARATPVHNIGDEFTWYQVPDAKAAKAEGELMNNCLADGSYCKAIDNGQSVIYSLRDKNGRPKINAELTNILDSQAPMKWNQFKGKSNSEPKAKYQPYIDSLINDYEPPL